MSDPQPDTEPWNPTRLLRVDESYDTSMGTTKVRTDATFAYAKVLGNRQGPHLLASEFVGTALARWFGLTVPDFVAFSLPADACFDLPRGNRSQPGPAFFSRHRPGRTWGGSAVELADLDNPGDVTRLVVFDTWVRNCDRHPPDLPTRRPNYANVYLVDTDRRGWSPSTTRTASTAAATSRSAWRTSTRFATSGLTACSRFRTSDRRGRDGVVQVPVEDADAGHG